MSYINYLDYLIDKVTGPEGVGLTHHNNRNVVYVADKLEISPSRVFTLDQVISLYNGELPKPENCSGYDWEKAHFWILDPPENNAGEYRIHPHDGEEHIPGPTLRLRTPEIVA